MSSEGDITVYEEKFPEMRVQCSSQDKLSALPRCLTQTILCRLPIRDAVRTSVLSRKWRYSWASIPKLEFNDDLFKGSSYSKQIMKYKLFHVIVHVLLLHRGPILEFSLCIEDVESFSEIDLIILHLSRCNTIEKFSLSIDKGNLYDVLSSFFSLEKLNCIDLTGCVFQPPLAFNGFHKLTKVNFHDVAISTKLLLLFLSKCPLIDGFTLYASRNGVAEGDKCNVVEFFECLPMVRCVGMDSYLQKLFVAWGVVPRKLPTLLLRLIRLYIYDLCFSEKDEFSLVLCLIRSSPNLEFIQIQMRNDRLVALDFNDMLQDNSDLSLEHLRELNINDFKNFPHEMEFVKLIMAKSPKLEIVRMGLDKEVLVEEELEILREIARRPRLRASPFAQFIVERSTTR